MKSAHKKDQFSPPHDALWYLSLGGAGEIGMNLSLYGTAGKWLMVDCGITFGDDSTPGIDILMPDIAFITERREDLVGLVVTHGHEDHIGAIEHLWRQFQCPIYATRFTAEMIRSKIERLDFRNKVKIHEVPLGGKFDVEPFKCEFVPVTHSIPESNMMTVTTQHGTVLHTGDWKFDPEPVVGYVTDEKKLKDLGDGNLMAVIGDSTNALVAGHSGSEQGVSDEFEKLFPTIRNRIIVSCFSSNIARIKSAVKAAKKSGRYVTLVGRSLWRNAAIAEACGYLPEFSDFLTENEAMMSPRDQVVMICTGCQGEPRSALWRIAHHDHPEVELDAGDTVIFSSRDIPGNEKEIGRLQNRLTELGMSVITQDDAHVHVSGHPAQEELTQLYQWTRPRLVVPVHGEARHQMEHARIAKECQVQNTLIPANGQIIRLGPGVHEVVAEVPHGRLGLDGKVLRSISAASSKERKVMSYNGVAALTLVMDGGGKVLRDPMVSLLGVTEEDKTASLADHLAAIAHDAVMQMPKSTRIDDHAVRNAVSQSVRRHLQEAHGKKPLTEVHVVRV